MVLSATSVRSHVWSTMIIGSLIALGLLQHRRELCRRQCRCDSTRVAMARRAVADEEVCVILRGVLVRMHQILVMLLGEAQSYLDGLHPRRDNLGHCGDRERPHLRDDDLTPIERGGVLNEPYRIAGGHPEARHRSVGDGER